MTELVRLRKLLHEHPEGSMHESQTKRILIDFLTSDTGLRVEDRGAWFFAWKKGTGSGRPIAFRADHDAVICADGTARHLCGHDGHSAALAGLALWLDQNEIGRDVYLIFQPGEETGEGAAVCAGLIEEKDIGEIYGFHNIPGYPMNAVILPGHTLACASTGLEICLEGRESHAAYPDQGANPAPVIAAILAESERIMKEEHRGIVLSTLIGIDAGSSSYGVSAGAATVRLTLRAEHQEEFTALVRRIEQTAREGSARGGLGCRIRRIEEFPATVNDPGCAERVRAAARAMGLDVIAPREPFRWSEDFGRYLGLTQGAFFGVGCGEDHPGLHTADYEFEDGILETVTGIWQRLITL